MPGPAVDGVILAEWVEARKFSTVRLRPGYDQEGVDAFLKAVHDTFLGVREPSLTSDEIRNKQFSTTRLRPGYDEEEVDAFLNEAEWRLADLTGSGVTTDDTGQCDPRGLPVPQDRVQPQDGLPGQPQFGEPTLDAYGLPVQERPATSRTQLLATTICGIVCAGLAAVVAVEFAHHSLADGLGVLGGLSGLATMGLATAWLEQAKKEQLGVGVQRFFLAMLWLGLIGGLACVILDSIVYGPPGP